MTVLRRFGSLLGVETLSLRGITSVQEPLQVLAPVPAEAQSVRLGHLFLPVREPQEAATPASPLHRRA